MTTWTECPHHTQTDPREQTSGWTCPYGCGAFVAEAAPCFCEGPWLDDEEGYRPENMLLREHESGSFGCLWPRR